MPIFSLRINRGIPILYDLILYNNNWNSGKNGTINFFITVKINEKLMWVFIPETCLNLSKSSELCILLTAYSDIPIPTSAIALKTKSTTTMISGKAGSLAATKWEEQIWSSQKSAIPTEWSPLSLNGNT